MRKRNNDHANAHAVVIVDDRHGKYTVLDGTGRLVGSNILSIQNDRSDVARVSLKGLSSHQIASGCSLAKLEDQMNYSKKGLSQKAYNAVASKAVLGYECGENKAESVFEAVNKSKNLIGCDSLGRCLCNTCQQCPGECSCGKGLVRIESSLSSATVSKNTNIQSDYDLGTLYLTDGGEMGVVKKTSLGNYASPSAWVRSTISDFADSLSTEKSTVGRSYKDAFEMDDLESNVDAEYDIEYKVNVDGSIDVLSHPAATCKNCGNSAGSDPLVCQRCNSASYCSEGCHTNHWISGHYKQCSEIGRAMKTFPTSATAIAPRPIEGEFDTSETSIAVPLYLTVSSYVNPALPSDWVFKINAIMNLGIGYDDGNASAGGGGGPWKGYSKGSIAPMVESKMVVSYIGPNGSDDDSGSSVSKSKKKSSLMGKVSKLKASAKKAYSKGKETVKKAYDKGKDVYAKGKETYAKGKAIYQKGKETAQKVYNKGLEAKHAVERKTGKYQDSPEALAQKDKVKAEQLELQRLRKGGRSQTRSDKHSEKSKREATKAQNILGQKTRPPGDLPPSLPQDVGASVSDPVPPIPTILYPTAATLKNAKIGGKVEGSTDATAFHRSFRDLGLHNYATDHVLTSVNGNYGGGGSHPGMAVVRYQSPHEYGYEHSLPPAYHPYYHPYHSSVVHSNGLGWAVGFAEGEGSSFQSPYFGGVGGGEYGTSVTPTVYSAGAGASHVYPIVPSPTPYGDYYGTLGRPRSNNNNVLFVRGPARNAYVDFLHRHPSLDRPEWQLLAPSVYKIYSIFWNYPVVFPLYGNEAFDDLPIIEKELWMDEHLMGDRIRFLESENVEMVEMGARILPHFEMQRFIFVALTVDAYTAITEKKNKTLAVA